MHNPEDIIETMWCGFIVKARVISKIPNDPKCWMGNEYKVSYIGERKLLDLGQNWYANEGDIFQCHEVNIKRAAEWRSKGY
jgi:hypothetical protein